MNTSQFRRLLIASLVFGLAAAFFDTIFPSAIPEALLQAQVANDSPASTPMLIYFLLTALIGLVSYLAALIGLFTFRPWAPRVALFTTALLTLTLPAIGVSISSGWSLALTEFSSILWGVVLALVYFSPIKEKFIAPQMASQETLVVKELAHPGKRFQGQCIDGLVAYFLGITSFYLLDILINREPAFYSGIAIGIMYFLFSDSLPNGQSIGKRLLNIQVLSKETMKPCSLFQSLLRNVTFPLGIFDWIPIFFKPHRRLGDFIASTIVVKSNRQLLHEPKAVE